MLQKTTVEIVLTTEEAQTYRTALHQAVRLLDEIDGLDSLNHRTAVRNKLLRLRAKLDDAPVVGVSDYNRSLPFDPFTPEGNGSAQDVLLGRIVSVCNLVLGTLAWGEAKVPQQREIFKRTQQALMKDWAEYEELSRG